jgi:hypothetical protein
VVASCGTSGCAERAARRPLLDLTAGAGHDPHITGYFIPDDPKERRGPIPSKLVHQAEDVLVDRRGAIYMSEGNSGIYVFSHNASR